MALCAYLEFMALYNGTCGARLDFKYRVEEKLSLTLAGYSPGHSN